MNIMNAIDVTHLHKSYGKVEVLKDLNLQVERGTLLALLGPNGAGKTTTVRILSTLLRYDSGTVKIFGHNVAKEADAVRRLVSLTGQFASLDDELSGVENLMLVARLRGYSWIDAKTKAANMLEQFELTEAGERQVKHYSGGMRRRLDIAASLLSAPALLFLDEPTTGLDPRSRRTIWDLIRTLQAAGTTVLLTTQYLEEADELADRIVIIDQGTIIADDTPSQLKASVGSGILKIGLSQADQRTTAAEIIRHTLDVEAQFAPDPKLLSAAVANPERLAKTLIGLSQAGIPVAEFALEQPSLDEVFLTLTGEAAVDETIIDKEIQKELA